MIAQTVIYNATSGSCTAFPALPTWWQSLGLAVAGALVVTGLVLAILSRWSQD